MPARPPSIGLHAGALPDLRVERTRARLLSDLLTSGLGAVRCGGAGWTDMATVGRAREGSLATMRFTAALDQGYLTALLIAARTPHSPETRR